jgi:hypothetical protein
MESYAWGEAADVWIGYDGCIALWVEFQSNV